MTINEVEIMTHEVYGDDYSLTITKTDEGFVLDAYNHGNLVLTEAMTAEEWLEWMADRQVSRLEPTDFKPNGSRIG